MTTEPAPRPRLLAIDGTALALRAFFAIRGLTDPQGRPSGAVYGYIASLLRALQDHPADRVVVAWDLPQPTFRHELDAAYKANREELDEDLRAQFPWIREVTELLGIPCLDQVGFEADDILASLAKQVSAQGWEVRLFTSDKDLAQVVGEGVLQCPPPKQGAPSVTLGPEEIEEKYGLPPSRMAEWQALVGDSSDNIQGMPGVGPKRATTLLNKYDSLEEVLQRGPSEEKGKLAENLGLHADAVRLALQLVTMRTDLELPSGEALPQAKPDYPALQEFCREHGLNTLGQRFAEMEKEAGEDNGQAADSVSADRPSGSGSSAGTDGADARDGGAGDSSDRKPCGEYRLVRSEEDLAELVQGLRDCDGFAFDTETTDVDPMRAKLVGMSFSWQEGKAWYVASNLEPALTCSDGRDAMHALKPLLEDETLPKFGQNLKYDAHVMRRHGVEVKGWAFDTMIAHGLLAPHSPHNMDSMARELLGIEKIPTKELLGSGKNALTMDLVPIEAVCEYACEDADVTLRLRNRLLAQLEQEELLDLFRDVEMPLVEVLVRMEAEGIRVDRDRLAAMRTTLGKRQLELEREVHRLADEPFNLNSPKQLGPILFEKLRIQEAAGVKRVARTKTGYRTDAGTMERYRGTPIVEALLEYRKLTKLIGTYVDALPTYVHPETGHIHSSFHQAVASTGRLSSSDPNLQNIPIRSEEGRAIRRAFVPRESDWVLLSADYSQVELRVVAHLSEDPALIQAFQEDADVHARTAALVFDLEPEQVDAAMRSRAKAINFGILYGMGPQRLARETGLSFGEAKDFIEQYFEALPGVRTWLDATLESARETGKVQTLLGRQRPVEGVQSRDGRVRSAAENAAVNTPVQGSAADLIKLAMLKVDRRLRDSELQARMILQVHDELLFDCPAVEVEALTRLVRSEMEHAWPLKVPLKVDVGLGPDWAEAH